MVLFALMLKLEVGALTAVRVWGQLRLTGDTLDRRDELG